MNISKSFCYIYIHTVYVPTACTKAGETKLRWAMQKDGDASTRMILPGYISGVLELRVCAFVTEHASWETKIQERDAVGKQLSTRQKKSYEQWQMRCEQQLVFSKVHEALVCDSKEVDKNCFAFHLLLSEDPEKLRIRASDGSHFRLILLKSTPFIQAVENVPGPLDLELPHRLEALSEQNSEESAGESANEEVAAIQHAEDQYAQENQGGMGDESDSDLLVLADSDEELDMDMLDDSVKAKKVKSFNFRAAWQKLEEKGLTMLPRGVPGCSISYHSTSRQWQGMYPGFGDHPMSAVWGGASKRTEEEAILRTIRGILHAHLQANPKDMLWKGQLARVQQAEATESF